MCKTERETIQHLRECEEVVRETRSARRLDDKGSRIDWTKKYYKEDNKQNSSHVFRMLRKYYYCTFWLLLLQLPGSDNTKIFHFRKLGLLHPNSIINIFLDFVRKIFVMTYTTNS